jgi:hypothetical protein
VADIAKNLELSAAEFLGEERFNEFRRSFADLVAYITTPELN